MNSNMTSRRLLSIAAIVFSTFGWMACSSGETRKAYDKYYGENRTTREAEAVVADSLARVNELKAREAEAAAAAPAAAPAAPAAESKPVSLVPPAEIAALMEKNTCSVCHKPGERLVGPPFTEIAKKNYTPEQIVELVHNPKPSNWPDYPPMAPLAHVTKEDIIKIAGWINSLRQ